jgi:hypothetical protein
VELIRGVDLRRWWLQILSYRRWIPPTMWTNDYVVHREGGSVVRLGWCHMVEGVQKRDTQRFPY